MKIYLETKDKDHHRIVFAGGNGKLVYGGEFMRRKADARAGLYRHLCALGCNENQIERHMSSIIERPYKPGAFAKNAGPKKKAVTKTSKK